MAIGATDLQAREGTAAGDPVVRLSVVSHGQDELVNGLLDSIARYCDPGAVRVTVTRNLTGGRQGIAGFGNRSFSVDLLENDRPRGFAANHNEAFRRTCREPYFCVLNPDIRMTADPFPTLLRALRRHPEAGVVAPLLVDSQGRLQDSARRFPTPWRILRRTLGRRGLDYDPAAGELFPDWLAGMFLLFPSAVFQKIGGFDPAYRLYCEDAEICFQVRRAGLRVLLEPAVRVVHDARRASRRDPRHFAWHVLSLIRFFYRHPFFTLP